MTVTLFIDTLKTGGAERQFALIADGLARRGHEVQLVTLYPKGQNWDWLSEQGTVGLGALFPRKSSSMLGTGIQFGRAVPRLRNMVKEEKPSIVYSGAYWCNLIGYLATIGLEATPVWGIRASNMELGWKQTIPYTFSKWLSSNVELAVANSHAGRDYHAEDGYAVQSWQVVPNGIETDRFRPNPERALRMRKKWGVDKDDTLIGTVARLAPMKDHPTLLKAVSELVEIRPNLRVVIVGSGKEAYERKLRRLAQRLGVDDIVIWVGKSTDVEAIYNALDLFVLPSAYGEGWPNVIGEAMASGVPCVATDVGDVSRILSPNRVVDPRSPGKLIDGVLRALNDVEEKSGRSDRQRIQEEYSVAQLARRTEQALASVCSRGRPE